ncbi:unnamed protein product [Effrenium voratum]|nr:unnamed protein product [Effrenium voratum]
MTTTIHADLHNTNLNNAALRIRLDELTWPLEGRARELCPINPYEILKALKPKPAGAFNGWTESSDSVLELLKAARESRYPRQGVTPLMLRLDQNNLPPKEILDKAEGVGVRCKVLTSDVELNEMMQRRKAAKQKPLLVATVPQTVDLPLFHDQMPRNPEKEPLRGIPRGVQGTPFQPEAHLSAPGPLRTTTWGPDTAPTTPERSPKTLESHC